MVPETLDIESLRALYAAGELTPVDLVQEIVARQEAASDPAIFITRADPAAMRGAAEALLQRAPQPNSLPLWGVPFAVKDNIDVAGLPTTAACPAFAYRPEVSARVVSRLEDAGAIVVGKTNLDQFATGLNGTRSPYGAPRSVFDVSYISGGSSSGSAVAVAAGLAAFALGTDTAGSGRVPASFNNLVGIKPTPGLLSTTGVLPACRSLDCVTVFANCVADGVAVRRVAEGFDNADPFSRSAKPTSLPSRGLRLGVLAGAERNFCGDAEAEQLYDAAIARAGKLGASIVPFDYVPFREIAALLYQGPWVAERLAAIQSFFDAHEDEVEPSVRAIIAGGRRYSAVDAFEGLYRFNELRQKTEAIWAEVDGLLLPTAPTTYTVEAMMADPIRLNSNLGLYTNFANLLGCAAIAVPAGFRPNGLPFGVTLVGRGFQDDALAPLADALHRASDAGMGRARTAVPDRPAEAALSDGRCRLVVVGAHLSGMPLNREIVALGGRLEATCRTAPDYRLYALPGTVPPKPGLVREPGFAGPGITVEVWSLSEAAFGRFAQAIPAPLGIGKIALDNGTAVSGFLCEAHAVAAAREVTQFGGWRAFVAEGAAS
ncbi:allophanate hydrolase [Lichenifustis flavocetrariae]|uniref:Allophanate hydrolase n=1 Tax=Lichenifustis flavocetrariae TaxID=2949735 RepID=A0AA41Z0T7_9HYPH|nr:allophanate hydrolase [Lichenifustis flavocetrariae]MCW6512111.1 allophanate hydrolase [Lichenifustis flavocetrariae]